MSVTRDYEIAGAVYPDPHKLYEKDEWYYESPYRPYRGAVCGFFFGIAAKMGHNWHQSRPMRAGLHMYPAYAVTFSALAHIAQTIAFGYYSYRERIYRHYIATHPEDFPPPPKVKVGEKWELWMPVR